MLCRRASLSWALGLLVEASVSGKARRLVTCHAQWSGVTLCEGHMRARHSGQAHRETHPPHADHLPPQCVWLLNLQGLCFETGPCTWRPCESLCSLPIWVHTHLSGHGGSQGVTCESVLWVLAAAPENTVNCGQEKERGSAGQGQTPCRRAGSWGGVALAAPPSQERSCCHLLLR